MDTRTVEVLWPFVLWTAALGWSIWRWSTTDIVRKRYLALGLGVAAVLFLWAHATIVFGVLDYGCIWEGFADGPLPIECRPGYPWGTP